MAAPSLSPPQGERLAARVFSTQIAMNYSQITRKDTRT